MATQHSIEHTHGMQRTRSWSSAEIVGQYLAYFRAQGHHEIAGSPLVLPGIGTSFVVAGMQPLMPYLRGQLPPPAPRLTGWQRCLRTDDADLVGTNGRKNSCFHMLGNWSIGDYGRREAIGYALDLLLGGFGADPACLWMTIFAGDEALGLPADEQAVAEWLRAGIAAERIVPLGADDNLWSTGGPGPCGPCTEIYVDRGVERGCGRPDCRPGCACERFLEIWNLVFIEYEQEQGGRFTPLPLRSVDTGMGLERIAAVLQGVETVFDTDLFQSATHRLHELAGTGGSGAPNSERTRARRMIVDHTRAALLAGLTGVEPGRDGRGSVLRRIIRRAARQGRVLELGGPFLGELVGPLAEAHGPLLTSAERERVPSVARILTDEERRFSRVLTAGLRELAHVEPSTDGLVPGERLFTLHAERGFPSDLAAEILAERGLRVDWTGYERAAQVHQQISRVSAERRFSRA
jgi:alanyl-tRNA synthetase